MLDILFTIVGSVFLLLVWVMLYDSNRFVVTKQEITDPRIKRECRALVLADLHNKRYGKENEKLLAAIRECRPDLILIAGDIPTAVPGKSLDTAIHLMKELAGQYPVYYGNGNHEQRMKLYPDTYGDMGERYESALKELGIRQLVNEHAQLNEAGILIYGVQIDRVYYKRFGVQHMEPDYLEKILGKPDPSGYTVLLAHNPDYFPQYADWGADLVLAGHVHGGMVRIPFLDKGVVSPNIRLFPKYDGGVFHQDKSTMILSRGLGMHTIPIRLFNPGELVVIDFKPGVCNQEEKLL